MDGWDHELFPMNHVRLVVEPYDYQDLFIQIQG